MNGDAMSIYQVKAVEYLVAVGYLLLFVPFWRFVNGGAQAAARVPARAPARRPAEWFSLPEELQFHPGHVWARPNGGTLVTVGMDDFAHRLIGPADAFELPQIGAALRQGEAVLRVVSGDKGVSVLSPLQGTVVAVNERAATEPKAVGDDAYGEGWLFKVKPSSWDTDMKQLLSGELARRWMEGVSEKLRGEMSPALGMLLQDGGQPVHGIAKELYPEHWDEMARAYLLS